MAAADQTTHQAPQQTTTVRVSPDIAKLLGVVAHHKQVSIGEYIERHLKAAIVRDYKRAVAEMNKELGGEGG